jgi:hypothetical protein
MPNYDFKKDLPIARNTEKEIATLLEKQYGAKILSFEDTNKYDILVLIKGKKIKIEIKEDFTGETTGNVGLEFSCRGKPSGIEVSEADYYIYKLHTMDYGIQYVLHSTAALKKMIANGEYFRIVNGGDKGSNSMNYLFKYNMFVRTGKILPLDKNL